MGVTGLTAKKKDFEHARVCSRNSAYAVHLTYETYRQHIYIYYIPPPLTVHFSMTRSVRYQPILEKWFPLQGERGRSF